MTDRVQPDETLLEVFSLFMDGERFDVRLVRDLDDPNLEKVHIRFPRTGRPCPFRMGSRWAYRVDPETGAVRVRPVSP